MRWSSHPGHCVKLFFCYRRGYPVIKLMRTYPVVPPHQLMADIPVSFWCRHVSHVWHPLRFQLSEQALHRRIVPAVSAPAHALLNPVSPQPLTEFSTDVLTTLIGVELQFLWSAALFIGHIQRLYHRIRVRSRRKLPADDAACEQIEDCGQVMPTPLCSSVRDVAAPDSIRCIHHKPPIETIRNIYALDGGSRVGVAARLFADQLKLCHQSTDLESPDGNALLTHRSHDVVTAR